MLRVWMVALLVCACGSEDRRPVATEPQRTVVTPIAAFWEWFAKNAAALHGDRDQVGVMQRITKELVKVHDGVIAEIGLDGDVHTLVISADGNKALFSMVKELYAARPVVPGWKIVAFRPRPKAGTLPMPIGIGTIEVAPAELKFVAARNGAKLDVDVFIPGALSENDRGRVGFLLLDHTLGEYDVETKIGGITFHALADAPADAKPFAQLTAEVDAIGEPPDRAP